MHKLFSQFCRLHCSSFILKPNAPNNIPFWTAKCKEKPPKPPNKNLKSRFNLMCNTQKVPQHIPFRATNISVTSQYFKCSNVLLTELMHEIAQSQALRQPRQLYTRDTFQHYTWQKNDTRYTQQASILSSFN